MNRRIRELRKALNLTQREFAARIGMKPNTIATYEIGRANPSDPAINNICKEFFVNEEWLRTGNGEMFLPESKNKLLEVMMRYGLPPTIRTMLVQFLDLEPEEQSAVINYVEKVADALTAPLIAGGLEEEIYALSAVAAKHLFRDMKLDAQTGKESSSEDK